MMIKINVIFSSQVATIPTHSTVARKQYLVVNIHKN